MLASDIIYLVFASIALIILVVYLSWIYLDEKKKKQDFNEKYNYIVSLLENISKE